MSRRALRPAFDSKWKCGWLPECNAPCEAPCRNPEHVYRKCAAYGVHELDVCSHGKWGFYYSSTGYIKKWTGIRQLRYNPSGCTKVYLLVYNRDKQQILFDMNKECEYNLPSDRRLTYKPIDLRKFASTFFATLFTPDQRSVSPPRIPSRFIFTDSSVIYPVCVTDELASKLQPRIGRKWFGRDEVEQTMKWVTLRWALKPDADSYGYEVRDRGARLGRQELFPLAAMVLRWLMPKEISESVASSRASSPVSIAMSSATSGYSSMAPSIPGAGIYDEPDFHITFDEFMEGEESAEDLAVSENTIILCYGVEHLDQRVFSAYDTEIFDNPFKLIARTLALKDKTIYLIISANDEHTIVPIIEKHYCVEKIYLYKPVNTGPLSTSSDTSEKVEEHYTNISALQDRIIEDIRLTTERLPRWQRSLELFTMLHTQQLENGYSVIETTTGKLHDEHIVILDDSNQPISPTYRGSIPCQPTNNVQKCLQMILDLEQSQIFFIVSASTSFEKIQSICDYGQIRAVYCFCHNKLPCPLRHRKLSGAFDQLDKLFEQLHRDVSFYQEHLGHTVRIDALMKMDQERKRTVPIDDTEVDFLSCSLFLDILPFVPALHFTLGDLTKLCEMLFGKQGRSVANYVSRLDLGNVLSVEDPNYSQVFSRLRQSKILNGLLLFQRQFIHIYQRILQSTTIATFHSVYLSKIITDGMLKLLLSPNIDCISIGIFVLATKSLQTARSIARIMAANGLISILFQIDLVERTPLLKIGSDRVLFRAGVVFRLESIHHAPDNVFYVRMKPIDRDYRLLKEQLEMEIDVKLSWLTYGNYLNHLDRFNEGEAYFYYLIDHLPAEDFHLPAIYNNLGLLYMETEREQHLDKAETAYRKAEEATTRTTSPSAVRKEIEPSADELSLNDSVPLRDAVDYSTIIGAVADLHYGEKKYQEALQSYMRALAYSNDQLECRYYQKMIFTVRNHLKEKRV